MCEVDLSSTNTAYDCRSNYGCYWKSDDPMTCSGYGDYVDAYVCNNLDITKCWGNEVGGGGGNDGSCSYCTDLVYYSSSNPVKACSFHEEDEDNGSCVTGFCRNNNCYVKNFYVTLANMKEE